MFRQSTRIPPHGVGVVTRASLVMAVGLCLFYCCLAQPSPAAIVTSGDVQPADPATWTTSTYAYVGKTADGTLAVKDDSDLRSGYSYLGYNSGVIGQVTVSGAGSTWTSNDLVVGSSGSGTLTIANRGSVSNNWCLVGDSSGSVGMVTVTGAKSTWTSNELVVGSSGSGTLAIANGGSLSSRWSLIGDSSGSVGKVAVTGAGSKWTNIGSSLYVGSSGNGTLTIADGGSLSSDGTGGDYIGMSSGSIGTVTVTGAGSKWTNIYDLYVGLRGSGTLTIADGGSVSTGVLLNRASFIGYCSSGTVTVTGAGSKWTGSYGSLNVGYSGSGTLAITDGGSVTDTYYVTIGSELGGTGTATVAGAGSKWSSGSLRVGYKGSGTLAIADGGSVSSYDGVIGDTSKGTVAGAGSTWTTKGGLYVSGTLSIADGGSVSSDKSDIGSRSGSISTVTVTGAASKWTNNRDLCVGLKGSGTLNIIHGGLVAVAGNTYVSREDGASGIIHLDGGTLQTRSLFSEVSGLTGTGTIQVNGLITDLDLLFDSADDLTQRLVLDTQPGQSITVHLNIDGQGDLGAAYGGTGSLTICNGVEVPSTYGYIGYNSGSTGVVTVDGTGSTWTNSSSIDVGYQGSGTLTIAGGGSVSSHGGLIRSTSQGTVTGAGSKWTSSSYLAIRGTLTIANGGFVSDSGISPSYISGSSGSMSTVTVTGAGSTWLNNSGLRVGYSGSGTLRVADGGSLNSAGTDGSCIGLYSGSVGTVTITGAGSKWTNSEDLSVGYKGSGTLTITNGGLVSVGTFLTIDYDSDGDGFVNMATGGMLAIKGHADDSLAAFLGLVEGTEAIRYWDDRASNWASITGATEGEDYTLRNLSEGDLAGYTLLTVGTIPEPGTLVLLAGLAVVLLARRTPHWDSRAALTR